MAKEKIIAVVGATGAQGGALVRAILSDTGGDFTARALTRSPTADKAKNLANLGADVVAADVDDGKCAYGIFQRREWIGETIGIAGEHLTGAEMAAAFTRALGQEVRYNGVSPDVYRSLGFPGADDLGNMFQFKRDFNDIFCGARNVDLARALNPSLQTFDAWLAQNTSRIPLEQS